MFEARWYQEEAIEAPLRYFGQGNNGNPVIALPTGTGKSYVIAESTRRFMHMFHGQRFICLTHVKELIDNNYKTLMDIWPNAPAGIFSSGLKRKDTALDIIYGGVQSVANCVELFGHRDLMFIDEAHLLSPKEDTTYQHVIKKLLEINPFMKVIGLSATPYRMGQGMITDGGVFTDICYDVTGLEAFNRLLREGYLAPLIPKPMNTEFDVSRVGMANGDFIQGQLADEIDKEHITYQAVNEILAYSADRHSGLIFAASIEHAEHISDMINSYGIGCVSVHTKISPSERDRRIAAWKAGQVKFAVNQNILTTGIDHPPLDIIACLRPTMSTGLWVQMLGRGTRPYDPTIKYINGFNYTKSNCLVLDFARNTARLGPINDPVIPKRRGTKGGVAPIKICGYCGCYNHASARICENCGTAFPIATSIQDEADTRELIKSDAPQIEEFKVNRVVYSKHAVKNSEPERHMLKATYECGVRAFVEYLAFEHSGWASKKARNWWRQRSTIEPPTTIDQALDMNSTLVPPRSVLVWVNKPGNYPEITDYRW